MLLQEYLEITCY